MTEPESSESDEFLKADEASAMGGHTFAIRPTKLSAKNPPPPRLRRIAWLFMGSEEAGQSNAIWYTLIESCRRRKIDPWKYLVWIFEELPKVKVTAGTFASYTPKAYTDKLRPRQYAKRTAWS
jgi:hypothetical protein